MVQRDDEGRVLRKIVPLEGPRKYVTDQMKTSIQEFPQGTAIVQLDATKILQFRKELMEKKGVKVSIGDIFVKAAACGLEKVPEFNGARMGDEIRYYRSCNIGMSASINGVLVMPVVADAQAKTVEEISAELKKDYEYLRKGKFARVQNWGATFSISNLGMYPVDGFTPLLNPPEGGMLGLGRIRKLPRFDENMNVIPVDEMTVSITDDHGLIDGVAVIQFLAAIDEVMQDPWTWLYHTADVEAEAEKEGEAE